MTVNVCSWYSPQRRWSYETLWGRGSASPEGQILVSPKEREGVGVAGAGGGGGGGGGGM